MKAVGDSRALHSPPVNRERQRAATKNNAREHQRMTAKNDAKERLDDKHNEYQYENHDQYENRDQYEDIGVNGVRVNGVTIFIVIAIFIVITINRHEEMICMIKCGGR
jgi:tetrahydromethanopterin S-methyltransferase subunit F